MSRVGDVFTCLDLRCLRDAQSRCFHDLVQRESPYFDSVPFPLCKREAALGCCGELRLVSALSDLSSA